MLSGLEIRMIEQLVVKETERPLGVLFVASGFCVAHRARRVLGAWRPPSVGTIQPLFQDIICLIPKPSLRCGTLGYRAGGIPTSGIITRRNSANLKKGQFLKGGQKYRSEGEKNPKKNVGQKICFINMQKLHLSYLDKKEGKILHPSSVQIFNLEQN